MADYDVGSFVASSTDGRDFGKLQPVVDELLAMSEGVDLSDPDAKQAFRSKVEVAHLTWLPPDSSQPNTVHVGISVAGRRKYIGQRG